MTPPEHHQAELALSLPPRPLPPELSWPTRDPAPPAGRAILPPDALPGISTGVFVQAPISSREAASRLLGYTGLGVVFTLEHKRYRSQLHEGMRVVEATLRRSPGTDVLVDRNLYSGRRRKRGDDGLSQQWIDDQHDRMGLPWALTDSGFCSTVGQVRSLLADVRALSGQVIVALPLTPGLLIKHTDEVIEDINDTAKPVAVMLEHEKDPFGQDGVVQAFTTIVRSCPAGVSLLRADASTLGALAHGAQFAAIGSTSGFRHIYPASDSGAQPPLSLLVPGLLRYARESVLAPAYLADPTNSLWLCPCLFCGGRDLAWIKEQHPSLREDASFQHSTAALAMLATDLHTHPDGPRQRWHELCQHAQQRHQDLQDSSGDQRWQPPAFLAQWTGLGAPTPA